MATTKDFTDFQNPDDASVDRLVQALDRAYHRPWLMAWRSFMHGFMAAIGAFVGTALIGIASVYIFQALGGIDLFKPVIDTFQKTITTPAKTTVNQATGE